MRIDHVVLAVRDLDATASRLLDEHGVATVVGGHHARWGTANRLAPLGDDYVELLSVVDEEVGRGSLLGRTLLELSAEGDRWFTVCVADDDIEATAERLGLDVVPGARTRPDGVEVRWRGAGIEDPERELFLPFFISWDGASELHPGRARIAQPGGATGIARVEVGGEADVLTDWLGDDGHDLPIQIVGGEPGVHAVALETADGGEIVL